MAIRSFFAVAALAALAGSANAQIITQWNFNSTTPDATISTGTLLPSTGLGTFSLVGGTTSTFASGDASGGSSDPATGDDSGLNASTFAAATITPPAGSGMRGVQFAVSTVGRIGIIVSWDQRHSNTSSRFAQFQYSTDGSSFINFGTPFAAMTGDTWFNNRTVDLSTITAVENNVNFAFRVVAVFDPAGTNFVASNPASTYGVTGTWRFDQVTVVPTPGSAALVALAGLVASRRRRA